MKKIEINGQSYNIECNAYTRILYNSVFGHKIFKDIALINNYNKKLELIDKENISQEEKDLKKENYSLESMDDILDVITRLTYITIKTSNKKFMDYNDWLESLPSISMEGDWVGVVMELITDCFRG